MQDAIGVAARDWVERGGEIDPAGTMREALLASAPVYGALFGEGAERPRSALGTIAWALRGRLGEAVRRGWAALTGGRTRLGGLAVAAPAEGTKGRQLADGGWLVLREGEQVYHFMDEAGFERLRREIAEAGRVLTIVRIGHAGGEVVIARTRGGLLEGAAPELPAVVGLRGECAQVGLFSAGREVKENAPPEPPHPTAPAWR